MCDNCCCDKSTAKTYDFISEAKLVLETIRATGNVYGATMICDVIRGSNGSKVVTRFGKLSTYGKGVGRKVEWWKKLISMLTNHGFIKCSVISGGRGCCLSVTTAGIKWLMSGANLIMPVSDEMEKCNIVTATVAKAKTGFTYLDSLRLLNSGVPTSTIVVNSGLKNGTIEGHIVKAYKEGMHVDFNVIKLTPQLIKDIKSKVLELGNTKEIGPVKKAMKKVTYLHIKLVKAMMEKEKVVSKVATTKVATKVDDAVYNYYDDMVFSSAGMFDFSDSDSSESSESSCEYYDEDVGKFNIDDYYDDTGDYDTFGDDDIMYEDSDDDI
jgi:superfamily II DNA helicase RecQ